MTWWYWGFPNIMTLFWLFATCQLAQIKRVSTKSIHLESGRRVDVPSLSVEGGVRLELGMPFYKLFMIQNITFLLVFTRFWSCLDLGMPLHQSRAEAKENFKFVLVFNWTIPVFNIRRSRDVVDISWRGFCVTFPADFSRFWVTYVPCRFHTLWKIHQNLVGLPPNS